MSGVTGKSSSEVTGDFVENNNDADLSKAATTATYLPSDAPPSLSEEHQRYLLERHGTLDLDPIPGPGGADPYNWPHWKKVVNLILVVLHAMMSTFIAAAIIPAFENMAADLGVSLQQVSYLTSIQIAILGGAPLIWKPFSHTFGRRPLFLLSLVCTLIGNIGCAKSPTYATMAVCRAIVAFCICPASAIGSAVVTETFFKKDRARYMGIWTLMMTLGVPIAPLVMGFVSTRVGYRWIYWILAMINGVQFIAYFFFGPETRYIRTGAEHKGSNFKQEYFNFRRIDPRPLRIHDFIHPLGLWRKVCVMIPAAAYAMTFLFGNTLIAVELPALFGTKFGFNSEQLGLQFLGMVVGSVLGEQLGGSLSDYWVNRRARKTGVKTAPEYRLWLSYVGFILAIVGLVVFLVRTQEAAVGHWNITPVVGIAIAAAGNQIVTTVLITYAVDCHQEESASIGVFFNAVRQTWAFIGPFWFPPMFSSVGVAACSGVAAALIVGVSIIPTMLVQWRGNRWRGEARNRVVLDQEQAVVGSEKAVTGDQV